ncbi:MAG: transposase [Proteobacteria bacterium]|nr:transposase [Pseudomonadota bacterium]
MDKYVQIFIVPLFKRLLRIVYLVKKIGKKVHTALLFSTDLELAIKDIYQFYKARFQIEFLFRDAKQFIGLNHCQARNQQALNFHFNATMTALQLNLRKAFRLFVIGGGRFFLKLSEPLLKYYL